MIPISNIIVAKSAHKMCTFCYIMCTFCADRVPAQTNFASWPENKLGGGGGVGPSV